MLTGQTTNVNDFETTPNGPLLTQAHYADLKKSGLSDDTILQSGCYSASADETRDILGFDAGPGLVFPYPGVLTSDGRPFCRVKPDQPPIINGKPVEYLAPKEERHHLYMPPNLLSGAVDNSDIPLIITVREKNALKGCQEAFHTIALFDAWSFIDKNDDPLPDFNEIVWTSWII